jgi:isoleucyl-tRNA synthetase
MKKDYKNTLNLPTTEFPMKANLPQREPQILAFWENIKIYQQVRNQKKGKKRFILHDGPPYANARPHLGTALNKILKDIVTKSYNLAGYDAPFIPGWDCHGLPIEMNVEKMIGKISNELSSAAFRKACREYAAQQVLLQKMDFQRLGVIADWENPYLTMDHQYEADVIRALAKIVKNGHLMQGQKPVHWCTSCGSALAEAEVEYQDKASTAIDVAFAIVDTDALARIFKMTPKSIQKTFLPIWTTTPWTLPANQAVAVNTNFEYVLVEAQWKNQTIHLVMAQELLESVLNRYEISQYNLLGTVNGELLEGLILQHPFLERTVPVVLSDHVTVESGTGAVHIAPAHGQEDYVVGLQYQLQMDNPVNANSCFVPETPLVGGLHVFKANKPIIEQLKSTDHLFHQQSILHSYPHCWRHKTPLIFRATPQWFIGMDIKDLRNEAIAAAEMVTWVPNWGQTRIIRLIETRPDWCISRQRSWGTPIPVFTHKETQDLHPKTLSLMETVAERIEKQGIEAWFSLDPQELLGSEAEHYEKCTDILDVWFDSGVSHFCVLKKRLDLNFPADLYFEGSDQHRGWFQSALLSSVAMKTGTPYKTVLTHGYVLDVEAKKMSKSLGNVVSPIDVANKLGADILRLWATAVDFKMDINFSEEILQRSADAYRRIRNTVRFFLANTFDFNPATDIVATEHLLSLDRWAIEETGRLQTAMVNAYAEYNFPAIYQKIHKFCTVQMGSFYLDIIKDRQYTCFKSSRVRRSAQTAMYHILEVIVRLLGPVISFTAEEIWKYIPGKRAESVFLTTWYDQLPVFRGENVIDWEALIPVRDAVNKLLEIERQAGRIGSALEAKIVLYAAPLFFDLLKRLGNELRFVLITSDAVVFPETDKDEQAQQTEISGLWVKIIVLTDTKCDRCWQRRPDVGAHKDHSTLCGRCIENLSAPGETRLFA